MSAITNNRFASSPPPINLGDAESITKAAKTSSDANVRALGDNVQQSFDQLSKAPTAASAANYANDLRTLANMTHEGDLSQSEKDQVTAAAKTALSGAGVSGQDIDAAFKFAVGDTTAGFVDAQTITQKGAASSDPISQQYANITQQAYDALRALPSVQNATVYTATLSQLASRLNDGHFSANQAKDLQAAASTALRGAGVAPADVELTLRNFFV